MITINEAENLVTIEKDGELQTFELYSDEGFEALAHLYLKVNWNQKYTYSFSWMGRPIIQLPDDMVRLQEVIYAVQPDIIVETGVAHGGSLIFYASLCKAMDRGRVIGVDIEIRAHNRSAIEAHPLADHIELIEGSSTAPEVIRQVKERIQPGDRVLVILDSDHSYEHVSSELRAYAPLVSQGSYIIATDGFMKDLTDVPRAQPHWKEDNPTRAALEFAAEHPEFVEGQPPWPFNESSLSRNVTHWPGAYLRRR